MQAVSVFGLGYVGSVSIACLAECGHHVIGVDINPVKVQMIQRGKSPVVEPGLAALLQKGRDAQRIEATTDAAAAVHASRISLICVGTPSHPNGSLNLDYVKRVCAEIGASLATKADPHTVVVRSTLLPGTTEQVVIPLLEQASEKTAGRDFGICFNPEFLREGSSIADFYHPPFTVIGAENEEIIAAIQALYTAVDARQIVIPIRVAEFVKYASNAFHALKVTFANELGNICKRQGVDSHQVMDVFCQDAKLNISSAYLQPGFAFGGSCLPKDLRALLDHARQLDLPCPVLESILPSNAQQIDVAYQMIRRTQCKRIGVLGFSFKAGTDDLRESPIVELIERLIGKGFRVSVYDKNVSLAHLHGANRAYLEQEIPHIACLMRPTIADVLADSQVIVIGNRSAEFGPALRAIQPDQIVIDLMRIVDGADAISGARYEGICW